MKHQLIVASLLLLATGLNGKNEVEALVAFNNLKRRHETDWLKFKTEAAAEADKIVSQIFNDLMAAENRELQVLAADNDCTEQASNVALHQKLVDKMALHLQHVQKWDAYVCEWYKRGEGLCAKNKKELLKFKQDHGLVAHESGNLKKAK